MPYLIKQFEDQELTVISMTGNIPPTEPLEALREFYNGKPTALVIWDFSEVLSGQLPTDEIWTIFDYALENVTKRPHGKTALVARTDYEYGIARMTSTMGELRDLPWELKVFRSLESAAKWLGVRYPEE